MSEVARRWRLSPLSVRGSLPLPLPADEAWAVFAPVERWREWDWKGSADARWLEGPPWTVGSRLRVGHRPFTFDCVVVEADPPESVAWEGRGLWFHGRHTFAFTPAPGGGCVVEQREVFTGHGARLLRPLIRWFWHHQLTALAGACRASRTPGA